jgi:drug/metabolite transporter (DMT)-like permease
MCADCAMLNLRSDQVTAAATSPFRVKGQPAAVMHLSSMAETRRRLVGIAFMIGAVACFACLDTSAKWLNRTMDPLQTASIRYVGSFLLVAAFYNPWTKTGLLRTHSLWRQCARAGCLVVATLCAFSALRFLPLTEFTSITFSSPLIVALIAGPLLGEGIGRRRLVAVLIGFTGVLVVTRPGSHGVHPAVVLAGVTACANAFYSVLTRLVAGHDSSETTLFYTGLVGSILVLPVAPFVWATPASGPVWLAMAGVAAFGALGHWLLILAHKRAPASIVAPFFYAQLLWATLLGWLVFGEVPDRWTLVGGAIVMSSGLYLLSRERARHKGG